MVDFAKYTLADISKEDSNRFDVDYLMYSLQTRNEGFYPFESLFDFVSHGSVTSPNVFQYCEIGDVETTGEINPVTVNIEIRNELNEPLFRKIEKGDIFKPDSGNILLSSVRPNLRKFVFYNGQSNECYFTKAFIELKPKRNAKILYYLLRTVFLKDLILVSRQGKGYPTLKPYDLSQIKFNKSIVDNIFSHETDFNNQISVIEKRIANLRQEKVDPTEIIDNYFSTKFGYDLDQLNNSKKVKRIPGNLEKFSNNQDLRMDYRFHSKYQIIANTILKKFCNEQIKDHICEPIKLGASISPNDYDEGISDYYYLSMATIKNWIFEKDNATRVKQGYWENKKEFNSVKSDDILLARSGEGTIGKFAIITEPCNAIFCDFTMRLRLSDCYPKFAYYFFRSKPFQALIETNKKGLGNNTNIFPIQVREFPLPSINFKAQKEIASNIDSEINKQEEINSSIIYELNNIEHVIQGFIDQ
jgi:type I restriction enzyme S subunit